jgi:membrane-associated protease RseP (regulator of RpoE activity)
MGRTTILTLLLATSLVAPPAGAQVVTAPSGARGWIGISIDVPMIPTAPRDQTLAVITVVSEGSPAESAGVRVGDRLVSINGHGWDEGFGHPAETLRPDDPVRIVIQRNGIRRALRLRAAERPVELGVAPLVTLTVRADTIVERIYRGMDSLKLRLVGQGGAGVQVVGLPRLTDSLWMVMGTRGFAPRIEGSEAEGQPRYDEEGSRTFVVPEVSPPFGFLALSGQLPDSLLREMEALNREIVTLRSQEAARLRTLAAGRQRVDQEDSELVRAREALEDASRRSQDLRSTMAQVARESTTERTGFSVTWSLGPDSAGPAYTMRPLAPYVLGQNRAAGAEVVELRPELAEYFEVEGGVLVVDVPRGTPASDAGLQPGDVLTHVDGLPIRSIMALRAGLAGGGTDLTVTLVRKGRTLEVMLHRD